MAAYPVYEDFEPADDWAVDEGSVTLILMLPGFKRDQLKVQITSNGLLKIHGERPLPGNRWRRFSREFTIPSDCDPGEIGAKFTGGLLYVKLQKKPPEEDLGRDEAPREESQDQQTATQEVSSEPREDKEEENVEETLQKESEQEKKPTHTKEMEKSEADANKEAQKEKRTDGGLDEEAKATTSKVEGYIGAASGFGKSITGLLSRQRQDYMEAIAVLIGRVEKQKKVASWIVAILFVVVLGLYVKNAVKSFHGRSDIDEL